jgi:hypothetical protein
MIGSRPSQLYQSQPVSTRDHSWFLGPDGACAAKMAQRDPLLEDHHFGGSRHRGGGQWPVITPASSLPQIGRRDVVGSSVSGHQSGAFHSSNHLIGNPTVNETHEAGGVGRISDADASGGDPS